MPKNHDFEPPSGDDIRRLLSAASRETDLFLVGGQALAFWMDYYEIFPKSGDPAITRDVDFYTPSPANTGIVKSLASALGGTAFFPDKRSLTALVGQAFRQGAEGKFINVDVIFRMIGISGNEVAQRATEIKIEGVGPIKVMDPLSVLKSRVENLYRLQDKQNDHGVRQLHWAIRVAQMYGREARQWVDSYWDGSGRDPMLKVAERIMTIAASSAGRGVSQRYDIHVADAIVPDLVQNDPFQSHRLPQVMALMSEERRRQIEQDAMRCDSQMQP